MKIVKHRKRHYRRSARTRAFRRKSNSAHLAHKSSALSLVSARAQHFAAVYSTAFLDHPDYRGKFVFNKISIRNQSSRWGSCSRKGNISFNYRLALLSPELVDYVVVHELCHLGEFNHSKKFWDLVEKTVPNWRPLRAELKKKGSELF